MDCAAANNSLGNACKGSIFILTVSDGLYLFDRLFVYLNFGVIFFIFVSGNEMFNSGYISFGWRSSGHSINGSERQWYI